MKIQSNQLVSHLQGKLLPIYLISGDEPLLVQEAADQIRSAAHNNGFTERELLTGEKGDAEQLLAASETMSLFSELKIFEFRLSKLPNKELTKAISTWCENPSSEHCLLISCAKLDKSKKNTAWYKKIEKLGAHIEIWPIEPTRLNQWIANRAQGLGLSITADALKVISYRVVGNLYAADQEIRRLRLLHTEQTSIDVEQMEEYVADNARFDCFELLESTFAGHSKKLVRILSGLKLEGEVPAKINGLLIYELRTLNKMAWEVQNGESVERIIKKYYIWGNKKFGYTHSLSKFSVRHFQQFLSRCLDIDKMIKGQLKSDPWIALEVMLLQMSGNSIWKAS